VSFRFHRSIVSVTAVSILSLGSAAQTKTGAKPGANSSATADRLGMTCAQILAMSSTDWIAKFTAQKGAGFENSQRAVSAYGKCYDAHTSSLAAALASKSSGPAKKARADFAEFETAVKAFTAKAIADAQPAPDAMKTAYVSLYEEQFRRDFYTDYEQKTVNRQLTPEESDDYRKAKNRFGELIGLLPDDKAHEVHEAFGDIVGPHPVSLSMNLALYRYAIFILEPSTEKRFAPPPF